ncbi:diguanylate cyclase (GGDEF) domain-containing protein [Thiohalospira halophila DSM 15071]|uniref:Diguanylate cyclase (GGDEF) domain-containing protein n=1 Tax=Thiohalospira halophila DSM 15071 TaxID=1123397 RepID=A0A1I1Q8B7_9GAMM|nr:EAL domain-containing protein [Thiohalospira halophila]SFD18237.1 diguanylate cyclase (GGDEF) domain-containing protein [Thiohalospira halophila DSM 15071]
MESASFERQLGRWMALAVAIPLLGFIAFWAVEFGRTLEVVGEAEDLRAEAGELSALHGALHALQRERSAAVIWLASARESFQERLVPSFHATDKAYQAAFSGSEAGIAPPPALLRTTVAQRRISLQEALEAYEERLRDLLGRLREQRGAAASGATSEYLLASEALLQLREHAGLERAFGAAVGGHRDPAPEWFANLHYHQRAQKGYQAAFLRSAPATLGERLKAVERDQQLAMEARRVGMAGAAPAPGLAGWFDLKGRRLLALRELEEGLLAELEQAAAARVREARARQWQLGLSGGGLLLVTGLAGGAVVRRQLALVHRREADAARIEYLATHNPVTGLPDRRTFNARLDAALQAEPRRDWRVLLIDLVRFTEINRTFGEAFGDELLAAVAGVLRGRVPTPGFVGQLYGDQFAVALPVEVGDAQSLLAVFDAPFHVKGRHVSIAVRAGSAESPEAGRSAQDLVQSADLALVSARSIPRGCRYRTYTTAMGDAHGRQRELEAGLERAVERDEFELWYQPQVDLRTGRAVGLEALLRWRHPERGIVGPGEFIPCAEANGLIVPVGDHVLSRATEQIRQWRGTPLGRIPMAVNLSGVQFHQADFIDHLQAHISGGRGQLKLEITESVLMTDLGGAARRLGELREMGVPLSVDDFGTGYSSLAYLRRFPVDELKLDRSFVSELGHSEEADAIVEAVVALGHTLGIRVLAEGVETESQARRLARLGCDAGQGFLWARPMPASDLEAWFAEERVRIP